MGASVMSGPRRAFLAFCGLWACLVYFVYGRILIAQEICVTDFPPTIDYLSSDDREAMNPDERLRYDGDVARRASAYLDGLSPWQWRLACFATFWCRTLLVLLIPPSVILWVGRGFDVLREDAARRR